MSSQLALLRDLQNAIAKSPKNKHAYADLGNCYAGLGRYSEAIEAFTEALSLDPDYLIALNNRGISYKLNGNLNLALEDLNRALVNNPNYIDAKYNKAKILKELNLETDAITLYQEIINSDPSHYLARNNLGLIHHENRNYDSALNFYQQTIKINPKFAQAYNNRGCLHRERLDTKNALEDFLTANQLEKNFLDPYYNIGMLFLAGKDYPNAIKWLRKLYKINPTYPQNLGQLLYAKSFIADWEEREELLKQIQLLLNEKRSVSPPFPLLSFIDDPPFHLLTSEVYTNFNRYAPPRSINAPKLLPAIDNKIRIGYFSSDFYDHATSHLISKLLEAHDRQQFMIYAFCFSPKTNDKMQQRIIKAVDEYIPISELQDADIKEICLTRGLDIAIDLKGYTQNSRPSLFTRRCAPIQVSWLGYPGTLAMPSFDYIIADQHVLPISETNNFSEKIIWLPYSYQPNDDERLVSDEKPTRESEGLPLDRFVFCSFNSPNKITPSVFDAWMIILNHVPNSVLWLIGDDATFKDNLRKAISKTNIRANRVIFAKSKTNPLHLARIPLADLCLDTFPYNGHTTTSDVLFMGVPVLTMKGRSFQSRVSMSLLETLGCSELVRSTIAEYIDTAIELARNPEAINVIKGKIDDPHRRRKLFDTEKFARYLEHAFIEAVKIKRSGAQAGHINVPEDLSYPIVNSLRPDTTLEPSTIEENAADFPNRLTMKSTEFVHDDIFGSFQKLNILDIGASDLGEMPIYQPLVAYSYAILNAVEGDDRHTEQLRKSSGSNVNVIQAFLFDGTDQTCFLTDPMSGMSSLLEPDLDHLRFFNGFEEFGKIRAKKIVSTSRLDELKGLSPIDFIKLDTQGSELTILKNGQRVLSECLALQIELSHISLYRNQPSFGEVDVWLRAHGFVPHCQLSVKRWSISPTIKNNNFRVPFNQLLESDFIYIKNPFSISEWDIGQILKLAVFSHYCLGSTDLVIYLLLELKRRDSTYTEHVQRYVQHVNTGPRSNSSA